MASTETSKYKRSMFLELPGEIGNQIYEILFTSTRLSSGGWRSTKEWTKPAPNSLAIVRTCRQTNQEARSLWLGRVLFHFENIESMLDKLSMLPSRTLSQIHHVRVKECYMSIPGIEDGRQLVYKFFNLDWALKVLPGLCLDTLTVIAKSFGRTAYWTLDGSIRHGNGWRELRVITSTSDVLGFARTLLSEPTRKPQPGAWKNMLHERDGADSGASVVVYRSTVFGATGSVTNPHTRQVFEQNPAPEELEGFGKEKDVDLTWNPRGRVGTEMMVVVGRGRHACIVEREDRPLLDGDIRLWTKCATWPEIRHHQTAALKHDGCLYYPGMEQHYRVEVDGYDEVEEYSYDRVKLSMDS